MVEEKNGHTPKEANSRISVEKVVELFWFTDGAVSSRPCDEFGVKGYDLVVFTVEPWKRLHLVESSVYGAY